jgi:UDP-3-O-[3-hydroxymyristoyl] N-acetylglucosamine deacetylase
MIHEKTIKREVSFSGVGLHSGKRVNMRLVPASAGTGIVFKRTDLGSAYIPVCAAEVLSTFYATTIGINGVHVQTVEHLLSALYAFSIDNLLIELDGEEVPIADGSCAPFIDLLFEAGAVNQEKESMVLQIVAPLTIVNGDKKISLFPVAHESLEISYTIAYQHPLIAKSSYTYLHSQDAFIKEIASARTFGFLKDIKQLLAKGYAKGGSLENAIVVGEDKILNQEQLRFEDEFVRHKVLDLIGDIALLGMRVIGRIEAYHAGHQLHTELIKTLRNNETAFRIIPASNAVCALSSLHCSL